MIAYLDTSAIVPLLIDEPSTAVCQHIWQSADVVLSSQLAFVETAAALARASRLGRMTAAERDIVLRRLEEIWLQVDGMAVDEALIREAAALTAHLPLRGYDAVHCAAALRLSGPDVIAASGDQDLLAAWRAEGLNVVDTRA